MTLKPGESTNLSLSFSMHGESMAGYHLFSVHLPLESMPDKQLTVTSNWVP